MTKTKTKNKKQNTYKSSKLLLLWPKHLHSSLSCASSSLNLTLALQIGQVEALSNQVSTHFRWNTCPQPGSFRHHCPCLNPSKQTTQSLPYRVYVVGSENLNWGSFFTNLEDNPSEESCRRLRRRRRWWRWREERRRGRRRTEAMPIRTRKIKKIENMITPTRNKERILVFGFGGGGDGEVDGGSPEIR